MTARIHQVSVYTAKAQLSKLLLRAELGEEITITKHGRAVAKLVPVRTKRAPRKLGLLKGKIKIAKDFDAPLPDDVIALFEGDE